jgi:hypothetical protein
MTLTDFELAYFLIMPFICGVGLGIAITILTSKK